MSIQVKCQGCGKSIAAPDKFAGKKVKCKCGAVFTVPSAVAPSSAGDLLDSLPEEPAGEGFEDNALSAGQPILPAVKPRRSSGSGSVFGRIKGHKLATAVAVFTLLLTTLCVYLWLSIGMRWYLILPPIVGGGLAVLGFLFKTIIRRKAPFIWVDPAARRIAAISGTIGLICAGVWYVAYLAVSAGHPIPVVLGIPLGIWRIFAYCIIGIGILGFVVCLLTGGVSLLSNLIRWFGLLGAGHIIYICLACPLLVVFTIQSSHELSDQLRRRRHNQIHQRIRESAQERNRHSNPAAGSHHSGPSSAGTHSRTPAVPRGKAPKIDLPPGANDPQHPEFYRVNLAELRSEDKTHRRLAIHRLTKAEPKELREEITAALKSCLDSSDSISRGNALKAFCHWSTDDNVPMVIDLLEEDDMSLQHVAFDILGEKKDPRAVEPVINMLLNSDSFHAARCLEKMGSMVEEPLLEQIDAADERTKSSIISILGAVGTEKSVAKLKEIADGGDMMTASSAKHALRQIERRNK